KSRKDLRTHQPDLATGETTRERSRRLDAFLVANHVEAGKAARFHHLARIAQKDLTRLALATGDERLHAQVHAQAVFASAADVDLPGRRQRVVDGVGDQHA